MDVLVEEVGWHLPHSKRSEPLTWRHSVTYPRTRIHNTTDETTSVLSAIELFVFAMKTHAVYSQVVIKKVKKYHFRPWQALSVPGGWGSLILRQSAHKGGKIVSPMHRQPLPPGNIPGIHFCQVLSRPQDHSAAERIKSIKNYDDANGNWSFDLPVCSAMPQPLRHRVPRLLSGRNVIWCMSRIYVYFHNQKQIFIKLLQLKYCIQWPKYHYCYAQQISHSHRWKKTPRYHIKKSG
jgi:hypothetical protein